MLSDPFLAPAWESFELKDARARAEGSCVLAPLPGASRCLPSVHLRGSKKGPWLVGYLCADVRTPIRATIMAMGYDCMRKRHLRPRRRQDPSRAVKNMTPRPVSCLPAGRGDKLTERSGAAFHPAICLFDGAKLTNQISRAAHHVHEVD